jgi:hypothetical protein
MSKWKAKFKDENGTTQVLRGVFLGDSVDRDGDFVAHSDESARNDLFIIQLSQSNNKLKLIRDSYNNKIKIIRDKQLKTKADEYKEKLGTFISESLEILSRHQAEPELCREELRGALLRYQKESGCFCIRESAGTCLEYMDDIDFCAETLEEKLKEHRQNRGNWSPYFGYPLVWFKDDDKTEACKLLEKNGYNVKIFKEKLKEHIKNSLAERGGVSIDTECMACAEYLEDVSGKNRAPKERQEDCRKAGLDAFLSVYGMILKHPTDKTFAIEIIADVMLKGWDREHKNKAIKIKEDCEKSPFCQSSRALKVVAGLNPEEWPIEFREGLTRFLEYPIVLGGADYDSVEAPLHKDDALCALIGINPNMKKYLTHFHSTISGEIDVLDVFILNDEYVQRLKRIINKIYGKKTEMPLKNFVGEIYLELNRIEREDWQTGVNLKKLIDPQLELIWKWKIASSRLSLRWFKIWRRIKIVAPFVEKIMRVLRWLFWIGCVACNIRFACSKI